jgi:hypothetical protein
MLWFFLLLGFGILSLAFVTWASFRRRRKITPLVKHRLREQWEHVLELRDPAQRVLEAEKIGDAILKALDYHGTFAEKLQAAGPRLNHLEDLWIAHRLRNQIAHDMGFRVSDAQAQRALQAFATLVHHFLG